MLLLRPILVFVGMVFSYIPYLQFVGLAIVMFIYHTLIKNRNEHIQRMETVYKANNWDFPLKKDNSGFLWFILYIISMGTIMVLSNMIMPQVLELSTQELESFVLPQWQVYTFIGCGFMVLISYVLMINRIVKDQWILQESEIRYGVVKDRIINYRDGTFAIILRIVTFNFYEWYLLYVLLRETAYHYFEDGTASDKYTQAIKSNQPIDTQIIDPPEDSYDLLLKELSTIGDEERFSIIFRKVTAMEKEKALLILNRLLQEKRITQKEYSRIEEFI